MSKCPATGKTRFESEGQAKEVMDRIKSYNKNTNRKHGKGKAEMKRVYYCEDCKGFHMTKWDKHKESFQPVKKIKYANKFKKFMG